MYDNGLFISIWMGSSIEFYIQLQHFLPPEPILRLGLTVNLNIAYFSQVYQVPYSLTLDILLLSENHIPYYPLWLWL